MTNFGREGVMVVELLPFEPVKVFPKSYKLMDNVDPRISSRGELLLGTWVTTYSPLLHL